MRRDPLPPRRRLVLLFKFLEHPYLFNPVLGYDSIHRELLPSDGASAECLADRDVRVDCEDMVVDLVSESQRMINHLGIWWIATCLKFCDTV